ncbi:MAG: MBG domain-containing protein, partial [Lacunisphaera sp.]|nr:MBG domain-containing protein [Lacunisphaera sp.]
GSGLTANHGNYTFAQAVGNATALTINPANLTLSGTRLYDGTTLFAGSNLTATGVNGETFTVTGAGATGNLSTRNVQTGQLLASVAGLAVGTGNSGAALASNYNSLATAGSAVSVTPKALTITADNQAKVYGAADPTLTATYTGLVNTDDASVVSGLSLSTATGALATAGSHAITAGAATSSNYTITFGDGTLTVTPATLAVTANTQTKLYGNADPALTYGVGTLQYADTAAGVLTGALTRTAGETVAGGPYQIGLGTLAANPNYTLTYTGDALTITPRPITLTPNSTTKGYGASDPALSVLITAGTLGSTTVSDSLADVTGTLSRQAGPNVGLYDVLLGTGSRAANYTITFASDNNAFAITPATLTYVANAASRLVGGSNPAFSGTVTGFVTGEGLGTATTGALAFGTTATVASPVGTYAINGSGLTANHGNYVFVQAPPNATAFTINPVTGGTTPLTITADNKAKLYGAALPAFTASFAGFINGDTSANVTGLQFSTMATMSSNVGTFAITPFGATAPATYLIGYVPGILTINPASLTVLADNKSRAFAAANPVFTGSFSGLVNGDTPSVVTGLQFSTTAATGSNTGTYTITPSGAAATNYTLAYISGTLTISPAALTLTATNAEREFGAPNPSFTGTFTGLVNGDTAAVVSGATFSTPATPASATGTYAITPRGATATNYTLVYVDGTLRVISPSVIVGTTPQTVITIDQVPVLTPDFAVVELGDRLVLVPVGSTDEPVASVDERLSVTLGEATGLGGFESASTVPPGATSTNTANLGRFELAASPGGSGPVPSNEPGLFRESTVNMGGFNIIYHEPVAVAREQSASNTALGSSYREFSDSDNPQTNIVRAKQERKPGEPAAGRNPAGAP